MPHHDIRISFDGDDEIRGVAHDFGITIVVEVTHRPKGISRADARTAMAVAVADGRIKISDEVSARIASGKVAIH